MTHRRRIFGPALGILLFTAAIAGLLGLRQGKASAVDSASVAVGGPSCRWGVTAHGIDQAAWIDDVGAGWYVFFGGYTSVAGEGIQIAPVITVKQDKDGQEYLDSYSISPSFEALSLLVGYYPGTLWIIGNEVDRGPAPGELTTGLGDTFPDVYATAYHDVYHFIKQIDPTALVANSALVQVTPGRLQYLDMMWQSYREQFGKPMPVDVWNMHIYVLPEAELDGTPNGIASVALGTNQALAKRGPGANIFQCMQDEIYCFAEHDDVNIFEQQARAMRSWMYKNGQQQKPLMLSEFSILYPCDDPQNVKCDFLLDEAGNDFDKYRVQNYLAAASDRLKNLTDPLIGNPLDEGRLVQKWAWFSIRTTTQVGDVSDLVKQDSRSGTLTGLTETGQAYRARAISAETYVNLSLAPLKPVVADTSVPTGTVDVTLSATVANNGSLTYSGGITVTFYADSELTQIIDQVKLPAAGEESPELKGCALGTTTVSATWPSLSSGRHPFWVKVEGQSESPGREADNLAEGFVLIDPERIWVLFVAK